MHEQCPPLPPFTIDTARQKVRLAEDLWNGRNPAAVAAAYTPDSRWRTRTDFLTGRSAIIAYLSVKWASEQEYRLIKELWGFRENRMAVRFAYEWRDAGGAWYRSYGVELWAFDSNGSMAERHASANDMAIAETDRRFRWGLGARPADHPGLTELGL